MLFALTYEQALGYVPPRRPAAQAAPPTPSGQKTEKLIEPTPVPTACAVHRGRVRPRKVK